MHSKERRIVLGPWSFLLHVADYGRVNLHGGIGGQTHRNSGWAKGWMVNAHISIALVFVTLYARTEFNTMRDHGNWWAPRCDCPDCEW